MTADRSGYGLLSDESFERSRKRIGIPMRISPAHITEVSADATRHFAYGYGDDNPLYCDPAYGKNTRWGALIAPPNFTYCMGESAAPELTAAQKRLLKGDPFAGLGSYQAAMEFEYYRPLTAGDRCHWTPTVSACSGRQRSLIGARSIRRSSGRCLNDFLILISGRRLALTTLIQTRS